MCTAACTIKKLQIDIVINRLVQKYYNAKFFTNI